MIGWCTTASAPLENAASTRDVESMTIEVMAQVVGTAAKTSILRSGDPRSARSCAGEMPRQVD
jgi:hypothetical protein